jgi:hypothetical protein
MKMAVFWIDVPYSLVEVFDVSEVLAASVIRAMSRPRASSVNFYQTTRRNIPEDSHLHCCSVNIRKFTVSSVLLMCLSACMSLIVFHECHVLYQIQTCPKILLVHPAVRFV